jgi:MoaA/NifB/PqqE/SkfB family radical SAM enzyme
MLSKNFTVANKIDGLKKWARVQTQGWPKLINLEVTKLCNAKCDFCPCWTIKGYPELKDYGPIMERFKPIVLSVNGGEPLLRKDIMEIMEQVRPHCTFLGFITHGQLLTEEKFKALTDRGVNQVSVSLNYLNDKHDKERQIEGLYKHLSTTLPAIAKKGYDNIAFNTVIMEQNLDQIIPIIKQAHKWGIKVGLSSYSELKNIKEQYKVREDQLGKLQEVVDEVLHLRKTLGNVMTSEYYIERIPEYFKNNKMPDCQAGKSFVQMTPDGYVKRCSEMPVMAHWTEYEPHKVETPNPCDCCWLACRGETESPITMKRAWEYISH